jgi:hypothetical protein
VHLCALILSLFAPDVGRLGADDYRTREAETRPLDNPVSVALLPTATADPEANARIAYLKRRHYRPTEREIQLRIELDVREADLRRWVEQYVALGRTGLSDSEVFVYLHSDPGRAVVFFSVWPLRKGDSCNWLCGGIWPGEYDQWRDHCDYHRGIAPPPREK